MLNYKHLHYFWVTARSGSVASAAEELGISPQAVSAQVGLLEQELGCELFLRVGRSLKLTDAGKTALDYAQDIFMVGEELEAALQAPQRSRRRRLRVGVDASLSKMLVYRLLMPSLRRPGPSRAMVDGAPDALKLDLLNRSLDLVLAQSLMPSEEHGLPNAYFLGESDVTFMAAPTLERLVRERPFPDYLADVPLILPPRTRLLRGEFDHWSKGLDLRPKVFSECDDSALMKILAGKGLGIIMVPSVVAGEAGKQAGLMALHRCPELRERVFAYSLGTPGTDDALREIITTAKSQVFSTPAAPAATAP